MISTGKSSSANCPPIFIRLHEENGRRRMGRNEKVVVGCVVTVNGKSPHLDVRGRSREA